MATPNDFDPLAVQDVIEKPVGIMGRRKVRDSLKPVGFGHERVFVDPDGNAYAAKGSVTAGEKYWTAGGTWLSIDIADHTLSYSFSYRDVDGAAGYQISMTVTARVADPVAVAVNNIRSVQVYIEPVLRSAVTTALTEYRAHDTSPNITTLNSRLGAIEQRLRNGLQPGRLTAIPRWLSVTLADVAVVFDEATKAHYDDLITASRGRQLAEADRERQTDWAEFYKKDLDDPHARWAKLLGANPTPENLQQVISMIDADERRRTTETLDIIKTLIDTNYFENVDQIKNFRALLDSALASSDRADRALEPGFSSDRVITVGEVIDSVPEPRTQSDDDSDRDWAG